MGTLPSGDEPSATSSQSVRGPSPIVRHPGSPPEYRQRRGLSWAGCAPWLYSALPLVSEMSSVPSVVPSGLGHAMSPSCSPEPVSPTSVSMAGLAPDLQHLLFWMANAVELLYFAQQQCPCYMQSLEEELDVTGAMGGGGHGLGRVREGWGRALGAQVRVPLEGALPVQEHSSGCRSASGLTSSHVGGSWAQLRSAEAKSLSGLVSESHPQVPDGASQSSRGQPSPIPVRQTGSCLQQSLEKCEVGWPLSSGMVRGG